MKENKGARYPEPDNETIESISAIEKYKNLSEKLEQIGFEVQLLIDDITCEAGNDKTKINQICGNIWYYMNYLRILVEECPPNIPEEKEYVSLSIPGWEEIGFNYINNENGNKMIIYEFLKTNNYQKNDGNYCIDCKYYEQKTNEKYYICNGRQENDLIKPLLDLDNNKKYCCDKYIKND
ncbi:hypothetical protein R84B8_02499 [Treponema sp. R8-4-B8]